MSDATIAMLIMLSLPLVMLLPFNRLDPMFEHPPDDFDGELDGPEIKPRADKIVAEASPASLRERWGRYVERFGALQRKYVDAETNPETWLYRPLLLDVTEADTAEFHRKFALASDVMGGEQPGTVEELDHAGGALHEAEQAWEVAVDSANHAGLPVLSSGQRAPLRRAQRALALALDERATLSERRLSLDSARGIAVELIEVMNPRQVEKASRAFSTFAGELEAGVAR